MTTPSRPARRPTGSDSRTSWRPRTGPWRTRAARSVSARRNSSASGRWWLGLPSLGGPRAAGAGVQPRIPGDGDGRCRAAGAHAAAPRPPPNRGGGGRCPALGSARWAGPPGGAQTGYDALRCEAWERFAGASKVGLAFALARRPRRGGSRSRQEGRSRCRRRRRCLARPRRRTRRRRRARRVGPRRLGRRRRPTAEPVRAPPLAQMRGSMQRRSREGPRHLSGPVRLRQSGRVHARGRSADPRPQALARSTRRPPGRLPPARCACRRATAGKPPGSATAPPQRGAGPGSCRGAYP